jgi:hypothetical protein
MPISRKPAKAQRFFVSRLKKEKRVKNGFKTLDHAQ